MVLPGGGGRTCASQGQKGAAPAILLRDVPYRPTLSFHYAIMLRDVWYWDTVCHHPATRYSVLT
eukprot:3365359-Rhodomonas_salina.1